MIKSKVQERHEQAMMLSDQAMVARINGDEERAVVLARQALEYESQAAALIPDEKASEPTRSILSQQLKQLSESSSTLKGTKSPTIG
ncbi:MAG: hypothetical protein DRR08_28600 [Candidatus Parabeggiatoa sp. nov. 2]|nr:MAG: hypothetical protein DRR08_28600 [Gammaproteobacteria bacterium]